MTVTLARMVSTIKALPFSIAFLYAFGVINYESHRPTDELRELFLGGEGMKDKQG